MTTINIKTSQRDTESWAFYYGFFFACLIAMPIILAEFEIS